MKLKSGAPFWPQATSRLAACPALRENLSCDVAVIGAGLTGALVTHALSDAGLDVVLADKREIGAGSTTASTALVLYEIDIPLVQLIRMSGKARAVRSYQCCRYAIGSLEEITRKLPDRCGFRKRSSLYLASRPGDVADLKKEFAARQNAGFRVKFLERPEIERRFSFTAPAAILSADAAEINPLSLTRRLVEASMQHGARAFANREVTRVTERGSGVSIRFQTGAELSARWLVMACGFETKSRAAQRVVKLKSTYALVTKPLRKFPRWQQRCLIWETNRPYFYLRSTPDNRIMIGGADANVLDPGKRDRLIPAKQRALMKKLRVLFPELRIAPAGAWAGTFGETKDGLPYIGRAERGSRILYALCYGANGTNFAVLAAEILRDSILGRRNADAKLFAFDR